VVALDASASVVHAADGVDGEYMLLLCRLFVADSCQEEAWVSVECVKREGIRRQ